MFELGNIGLDKGKTLGELDIDTVSLQVIDENSVWIDREKEREKRREVSIDDIYKEINFSKKEGGEMREEEREKEESMCFYSMCWVVIFSVSNIFQLTINDYCNECMWNNQTLNKIMIIIIWLLLIINLLLQTSLIIINNNNNK